MSYIQFLGAAGTVTGSKHLVNSVEDVTGRTGVQVLIDCGLFQGPKQWRERNWRDPSIPAAEIEAVILTHAHLDHSGWIPRLVKEGFKGPIYATPATVELCGIVLPDSGYLQEEDAYFHNKRKSSKHTPALPLYTLEEAQESLKLFKSVPFGDVVELGGGVSFRFVRAAHILGSAMVELTMDVKGSQRTLLFTGDIGRLHQTTGATPSTVIKENLPAKEHPDVLVTESTYGNRLHPAEDARPKLCSIINETVARGGTVVVPSFAVERTQKFLFLLKELMEAGRIPRVPVYADSPMGIKAVKVFLDHREEFNYETRNVVETYGSPLDWPGFHFALSPDDSKKINNNKFPSIILSANGMCMGGRIQHHLAQRLPEPKNTILFIGFQSPGTRGRQIRDGEPEVKIYGEIIPVRAHVETIDQFSDHADYGEILRWLHTFTGAPTVTHVVHGEPESAEALRQKIEAELHWKADVAAYTQKVEIE